MHSAARREPVKPLYSETRRCGGRRCGAIRASACFLINWSMYCSASRVPISSALCSEPKVGALARGTVCPHTCKVSSTTR